jgi:hypothetical protein
MPAQRFYNNLPAGLSSSVQDSAALRQLIETLLHRHGDAINAILLYGSCLRSQDLFNGLADLYLIVDNYRHFYGSVGQALANRLLPPNVFYIEIPVSGRRLRAKYAVLSAADFARGTSRRWFHSYLWGRFAQPSALVYYRDERARQQIETGLAAAVRTFLERILPALPPSDSVRHLWQHGLQLSYGAELRAEGSGRSAELVDSAFDYYYTVTVASSASLGYPLTIRESATEAVYYAEVPPLSRYLSRITWPLRQVQGKLLSVLRLLKALFTFQGGLDYIAWKLERHTGKPVVIPERVRRYPLIFIWGLFWRFYRLDLFR